MQAVVADHPAQGAEGPHLLLWTLRAREGKQRTGDATNPDQTVVRLGSRKIDTGSPKANIPLIFLERI